MAEIRTVTTLRRKRVEIAASVRLYERQLEQAKEDLAHVLAAIRIFEASGDPNDATRYPKRTRRAIVALGKHRPTSVARCVIVAV
jgi:hypothetical protein